MNNITCGFFRTAVISALIGNMLIVACEQNNRPSYEPRDYLKVLRCCEKELREATPNSLLFKSMSIEAWRLQSLALGAHFTFKAYAPKACGMRSAFMEEIKRYNDRLEDIGSCRDMVEQQVGGDRALNLYKELHRVNIRAQGGAQRFDEMVKKMADLEHAVQQGDSHN